MMNIKQEVVASTPPPVVPSTIVPNAVPDLLSIKTDPEPSHPPPIPSMFDPLPESPVKEEKPVLPIPHHNESTSEFDDYQDISRTLALLKTRSVLEENAANPAQKGAENAFWYVNPSVHPVVAFICLIFQHLSP